MQEAGSGSGKRPIDDVESVELEFPSFRRFQEEYLRHLSTDGLFVESTDPLPPSTVVRFRVRLPEDVILIEGTGVVIWVREAAGGEGDPPGMAIRFVALGRQSKDLIEKLVRGWEAQGGVVFDLDARSGVEEQRPSEPRATPPTPSTPPATTAAPAPAPKAPRQQEQIRFTIRGSDDRGEAQRPPIEQAAGASEDDALARTIPERPITSAAFSPPEGDLEMEGEAGETGAEQWELEYDQPAEQLDPDRTVSEPMSLQRTEGMAVPGVGGGSEASQTSAPGGRASDEALPGEEPQQEIFAEAETATSEGSPDEQARPDAAGRVGEAAGLDLTSEPGPVADPPSAAGRDLLPPVELDRREPPSWGGSAARREDASPEPAEALAWSALGDDADDDETPVRLPGRDEALPDVTLEPSEDSARRRPWPWLALVAVLVAAVAGVVVWRDTLEELVAGWTGRAPARPVASADAGNSDVGAGATEPDLSTGAAVGELGETGGTEQAPDTAVGAPVPTAVPTPVPTAVSTAVLTRAAPSSPASVVSDITWSAGDRETSVTVTADGELRPDMVAALPMGDPPRILLRLRGIVEGYPAYSIEAGTPQLDRIRIGHHPEQRPPALYVVLDLPDAAVKASDVHVAGDRATVTLSRE